MFETFKWKGSHYLILILDISNGNNLSILNKIYTFFFGSYFFFPLNIWRNHHALQYLNIIWYVHLFSSYFSQGKVSRGLPGSSAGKESACNAGDPGLIPGSGSSPGEGIGYPLQYSWSSLVAQMVKNLPAVRETWVQFLGWIQFQENPLEEGMATHSSVLTWRIPMDRGALGATVHGVTKSWTWMSNQTQHSKLSRPLETTELRQS